jgi:hypothetical protein
MVIGNRRERLTQNLVFLVQHKIEATDANLAPNDIVREIFQELLVLQSANRVTTTLQWKAGYLSYQINMLEMEKAKAMNQIFKLKRRRKEIWHLRMRNQWSTITPVTILSYTQNPILVRTLFE